MRTFVDARYLEERERFALRATCGHCQHFDRRRRACSLGFPSEPHQDETHARAQPGQAIMFCKFFEMD